MKTIHIIAMGGTIAYLDDSNKRKNVEALIYDMGGLPEHITITYDDLLQKPSSDLHMEDVFYLAKEVRNKIDEGVDGIVITQGTDTMEETSFAIDLLIESKIPIVFTGALRHSELRGSEGDANLFSAIMVASREEFSDVGCVIVLHDEIHSSRYTKKTHTQSTSAFESQFGPIGYITEGIPRLIMRPILGYLNKNIFSRIFDYKPSPVFLASMPMGEEGQVLDYVLQAGYQGIVIDGLGGGHVSKEFAERIEKLINKIPVVVSSRTGKGEVLKNTYRGYPGSEVEMIRMGCVYSGILDSRKARILLILLLTCNMNKNEIRVIFQEIGELTRELVSIN